ncbi:MAG: 3-oxoacyl-[acyl-carrier-protein] reductase [Saprospiraceae bacterium]
MGLLNNKVAIITGGSRGIGEGIVRKFVAEGALVAFSYRSSSERADAIIKELGADKVMALQSDASKMEDAEELISATVEKFGKIDILVNNAGITKDTLMLRMSEAHWDDVMNVNLKSVFVMTKSVLKTMMRQRQGSIIHMGSVVGVFGNAGQANYAASKAGIIGFSKSIAKEVGSRNIRSNVITPGFIQTEMTGELDEKTKEIYTNSIPLKSFGQPDDIANACIYLGSEMSSYVTGQVLSICGGMNM